MLERNTVLRETMHGSDQCAYSSSIFLQLNEVGWNEEIKITAFNSLLVSWRNKFLYNRIGILFLGNNAIKDAKAGTDLYSFSHE
jgi:hypothetical protein